MPRTLTVLRDGRALSDRSAEEVRSKEWGHEHVERTLMALGASAPRAGVTVVAFSRSSSPRSRCGFVVEEIRVFSRALSIE